MIGVSFSVSCGGDSAESTTIQTVRAFRRLRVGTRRMDWWGQLPRAAARQSLGNFSFVFCGHHWIALTRQTLRWASGLLRTNASAGNRPWAAGEDIHGKRSCTTVHDLHTLAEGFGPTRYYAIVITSGGRDLNELLVSSGLARIYGTRTPLPDGRDSREYLAHLHALENEAKAAKRGGWGMVQPWSLGKSLLTISAKPVGVGAAYQPWIPRDEQSGVPMHTAAR